MSFLTDLQTLIVDDPSINEAFYNAERGRSNIYFQLLPKNIDKLNQVWLRYGFFKTGSTPCMGGGTSEVQYSVFVDCLSKTINDLPGYGDLIVEKLNYKSQGNITDFELVNDAYTNYAEEDIYVITTNFLATYKMS